MAHVIRSAASAGGCRPLHLDAIPRVAAAHEAVREPSSTSTPFAGHIAALEAELHALRDRLAHLQIDEAGRLARARDEAVAAGYVEGKARAEDELANDRARFIERTDGLLRALREQEARRAAAAEDTLVAIAFAAVCKVLGDQALEVDGIRRLIREASAELSDRDDLLIRLRPEDVDLLNQSASPQLAGVALVPDDEVGMGGCIVESTAGTLDARLETQLRALAATLSAVRIERRAAAEGAS